MLLPLEVGGGGQVVIASEIFLPESSCYMLTKDEELPIHFVYRLSLSQAASAANCASAVTLIHKDMLDLYGSLAWLCFQILELHCSSWLIQPYAL